MMKINPLLFIFLSLFTGFLTFINCYNVDWSTFLMDSFTFAKIFALTIIIGVGFWQIVRGKCDTHSDRLFKSTSKIFQIFQISNRKYA